MKSRKDRRARECSIDGNSEADTADREAHLRGDSRDQKDLGKSLSLGSIWEREREQIIYWFFFLIIIIYYYYFGCVDISAFRAIYDILINDNSEWMAS